MKKIITIVILAVLCTLAAAQTNTQTGQRSDRKIIELKKIITLSPTQEVSIREAYEAYSQRNDSILYKVQDPVTAAYQKRRSEKLFNKALMKTLTEKQRNEYIRVTCTPEVMEKAEAKVDVLKETGKYTPIQLDSAKVQIFDYLMLEKVVYARDKYDYRKQKENISQLKKKQPTHLRQAEAQEKAIVQKKSYEGQTQW